VNMKKMLIILVCLLPLLCAEGGNLISVDDDGGDADFTRIQAAIDDPGTQDGDTIAVHEGTYNENIRFKGKAVEIRSLFPESVSVVANTIITASSDYSVRFDQGETSGSVLSGFTINGRGIYCDGSSPVISKNVITNCNNNGITGDNYAHPLIEDNTITFNGPIALHKCLGDIIDNIIMYNGNEGAIRICDGEVSGNIISYNVNTGDGGGLYQCTGNIRENVISYNEAGGSGGAIYANSNEIAYNTIVGNRAGGVGGGLSGCVGDIGHNIIAGNRAMSGSALANCGARIYNNTITGNRVEGSGTLNQCYGVVQNNIIAFNDGPPDLGGMYGGTGNSYNCFWANSGDPFSGGAAQGEGDLVADPCFAERGHWDANGTVDDAEDDFWVDGDYDYHVLSENGRWDWSIQRWVYDSNTSPCIDAGYESWDWKGEYWPHGGRINQGQYGGTSEASMSLVTIVGNVADLNLDEYGWVDFRDLMLFAEMWPSDLPLLREDLNRNGRVDLPYYAMFAANWQTKPPPSPNPMTWENEPYAISTSEITMKASDANSSDGTGVEYRFEEITGNPGGTDRDWYVGASYTDTGLSEGFEYCYIVRARNTGDKVETEWSREKCVRTWSPPSPDPMTWASESNATDWDTVTMKATDAVASDGSAVEYRFEEMNGKPGSSDRNWDVSPYFTDTGLYDANTYCYRVKARNAGNKLETDWSTEVCVITPTAPPPSPDPNWSTPPEAASYSSITMVAEEAEAGDGSSVEYYFENVTVTDGSHDRDWGSSHEYLDTGLSMKAEYCYRVKARNARNHKETGWSSQACATTPCNDTTAPYFPNAHLPNGCWESIPCEELHGGTSCDWYVVMTAAEAEDDSGGTLEYRFVCTNESDFTSGWQISQYYQAHICRSHQGLDFYVEVRDVCENSVASPVIKAWPCE